MKERMSWREDWKCATIVDGALSVVNDGHRLTHKWYAIS